MYIFFYLLLLLILVVLLSSFSLFCYFSFSTPVFSLSLSFFSFSLFSFSSVLFLQQFGNNPSFFRSKQDRLKKMDDLCARDKDQEMAYILRVLRRDFKGQTLCKFTRGGDLMLATLSILKQLSLSKDKYLDLKYWLDSVFEITLPSWQSLRKERLKCSPPIKENGEDGHSCDLQAVLNFTMDR